MHQRKYAAEILKRFDMADCNHAVTPSEPRLNLSKSETEEDVDPTKYRSIIGSLTMSLIVFHLLKFQLFL
jgi:hypothetical protein